jgi:hypothetical protein
VQEPAFKRKFVVESKGYLGRLMAFYANQHLSKESPMKTSPLLPTISMALALATPAFVETAAGTSAQEHPQSPPKSEGPAAR